MGRIAALVPEFAVKDLPLGRTLMMILLVVLYGMVVKLDLSSLERAKVEGIKK